MNEAALETQFCTPRMGQVFQTTELFGRPMTVPLHCPHLSAVMTPPESHPLRLESLEGEYMDYVLVAPMKCLWPTLFHCTWPLAMPQTALSAADRPIWPEMIQGEL
jgi:hypothetical protein